MNLTLYVWRQPNPRTEGGLVRYDATGISPDMSFLEMLDVVNEGLIAKSEPPIAFDHDCREGICGSCGMMINGVAHGPNRGTATCQLHTGPLMKPIKVNFAYSSISRYRASTGRSRNAANGLEDTAGACEGSSLTS